MFADRETTIRTTRSACGATGSEGFHSSAAAEDALNPDVSIRDQAFGFHWK